MEFRADNRSCVILQIYEVARYLRVNAFEFFELFVQITHLTIHFYTVTKFHADIITEKWFNV